MPKNVEIKAKIRDLDSIRAKAKELSGEDGTLIEQEDTFFKSPKGRLKLRKLIDRPSQLIYYERPDKDGPKLSDYHIACTETPDDLRIVLEHSLGIKGIVKKRRYLYMVGQTRVHIDSVEGLGDFMELEVVLEENQTVEYGQQIANDLQEKLGVLNEDLLTGAYMDLILAKAKA
ncbi:uncharacterized protein LOC116610603 [Nematostella vectensis]|uniref:uncharacterized protein LOC116610603 n=1 Tax=Nematostella vectensis TaxID=45351 RepID=UPI00207710F2|nr:uncharacterized protein LOC116610603 [Nematostella vectensis]